MTISVPRTARALSVYVLITFLSAGSAEAAMMTLCWDPNPDAAVVGYRVLWGTRPGQYTRVVDVGANTSFQFEGPTLPTIYYFSVRAYDTRGNESEPSIEVNTGPGPMTRTTITSLAISASRAAPQLAHTAVRFTAMVIGEKDYRYRWSVYDGVSWSVVREWAHHNTFVWTPTMPNVNYRIMVRIQNVAAMDTASTSLAFPIIARTQPHSRK